MRRRRHRIAAVAMLASLMMIPVSVPAKADLPDAYTQIVNHQIPVQRDGAPTYYPLGWGRHYIGPNGYEVRLTSAGTSAVLLATLGMETAGTSQILTGSLSSVGSLILSIVPPGPVRTALGLAGIPAGIAANDAVNQLVLKNLCLGVTVPTAGLETTLNRAAYLMANMYVQAFQGPYYNDLRIWFEHCNSSPSPVLGDVFIPVNLPGIEGVVAAQPIAPPPPPPALLVIRTGTSLNGKTSLTGNWTWSFNPTPATDVRVSGQRITYTDTNGHLWAKEGLTGTWYDQYNGASQYAASPSLVVIRTGTSLHGKVALTDNWTWSINPTPAVDVRVTGNRISYTDTNGNIWAKDGLTGTWYQLYSAVSQYALSPSLIVIRGGGSISGKTSLTGSWTWTFNATPVTDIRVAGDRITYMDTNGHLYAKDGLTGTWYDEYPGASQYAASSSLLVIRTGTDLLGKAGLTDNWVLLNGTPATDVTVSGNRIMYTDTNGHLWAKDGLYGGWVDEYTGASQYATS